MTKSRENLATVYAERSIQAARNLARADRADTNDRHPEARLFRALAQAQTVQATKALLILQGMAEETPDAINAAGAETELTSQMLQAMVMTAATEREPMIESCAIQFSRASSSHATMLQRVSQKPEAYHVCQICGHMVTQPIPERCPVCRAVADQFLMVE